MTPIHTYKFIVRSPRCVGCKYGGSFSLEQLLLKNVFPENEKLGENMIKSMRFQDFTMVHIKFDKLIGSVFVKIY